jgi:hypothetical protein
MGEGVSRPFRDSIKFVKLTQDYVLGYFQTVPYGTQLSIPQTTTFSGLK